jgi:hypothetical protein
MKKEQIQYFAGIIDSEGSFSMRVFQKGNSINLTGFKLEICDRDVLAPLADYFDLDINSQDRGANRKLIYNIRLGNKTGLIPFIELFLPYLNEKRVQAQLILDYFQLKREDKISKRFEFMDAFSGEKKSPSTTNVEFSLPYLAGIMDGDGYFNVVNSGHSGMNISIGLEQCYPYLAEYLQNKFGGSVSKRYPANYNHRERTTWTYSELEGTNKLIKEFAPYIIIKTQNIKNCEKLYKVKSAYLNFVKQMKAIRDYE